jgi:hypothetical protein
VAREGGGVSYIDGSVEWIRMPRKCFNNFGAGKFSPNGELLFLWQPTIYWFWVFPCMRHKREKVLTPTSYEGKGFYAYLGRILHL